MTALIAICMIHRCSPVRFYLEYTAENPNTGKIGDNTNSASLFSAERLSSFRGSTGTGAIHSEEALRDLKQKISPLWSDLL